MSKHSWLLPPLLAALAIGCAPSDNGPPQDQGKPSVVATTGMIADTAARIGGTDVNVVALMGPGVDPHLYKASEGDVQRLGRADLILYNGLHLEGKMGEVLSRLARRRPVVAVAEAIDEDRLRRPPEFDGAFDPHVWFDVSLWIETLDPIVEALSGIAPEQRGAFEARADELRAELIALDREVSERIATIAAGRRVLVTAHDAFGYFGARYDIDVIGLQGLSTLSEAGLQDIERVVDVIVERDVKAVFVESSVPRRAIEAVQAACRSRGHQVSIGGELFSDAMGMPGTPEGTYPGMVRHNVDTIVSALE